MEIVGNSRESWEEAAQNALEDAQEEVEDISAIEVKSQTAEFENGQIERYKTTVSIARVI